MVDTSVELTYWS